LAAAKTPDDVRQHADSPGVRNDSRQFDTKIVLRRISKRITIIHDPLYDTPLSLQHITFMRPEEQA
jgi:hypothetical protein